MKKIEGKYNIKFLDFEKSALPSLIGASHPMSCRLEKNNVCHRLLADLTKISA
jgi:hypothetical protein